MDRALNPPDPEEDILARFRTVAARLPDRPAILDETGVTTYAALRAASEHLAAQLAARRGTDPEPVALLVPDGALLVRAMLGVLGAGKFFVPLDPAAGAGALRTLLRLSEARLVVTTGDRASLAESVVEPGTAILALDALPPDPGLLPPSPKVDSGTLASLGFTSGSTGTPKGILWNHSAWSYRALQALRFDGVTPEDRVAQTFSPAFMVATSIVFFTILNGATLCPAPPPGTWNLFDWLRDRGITVFLAPVGLLRDQLSAGRGLRPAPSVRTVILGGQRILYRDLVGLPELVAPDCVIVNRLSMSEFPIVTRFVVDPKDIRSVADPVPVGYPVVDGEVMLWDDDGRPVSPGDTGQIVVRSARVTPGYWRDPELDAAKILADSEGGDRRIFLTGDRGRMRPDGCLEYLGREDLMVKIRGYRVEPEAVERSLLAHPGIRECAVEARPQSSGELCLVAYLGCPGGESPGVGRLRAFLAGSLPAYMVPARFVTMERLPRNVNGKIDRGALPPPGRTRPLLDTPFEAPRNDLERNLAEIWAEVLELDEVGIHDSFFELGGDSLLILRMSLRIEELFHARIPPEYVHRPTVALLAGILAGDAESPEVPSLRPFPGHLRSGGTGRLLRRRIDLRRDAVIAARLGATEIALRMPYPRAVRRLARFCALPPVRSFVFRYECELHLRLARALGMPAPGPDLLRLVLVNALLCSAMQRWPLKEGVPNSRPLGYMAASRYPMWRTLAAAAGEGDPAAGSAVVVGGRALFDEARGRGDGVVLVSYHSTIRHLLTDLLARLAPERKVFVPSQAVARKRARYVETGEGEEGGRDSAASLRMRELAWSAGQGMEGLRTLREGGVVLVVPDSVMVDMSGGLMRPVGGRVCTIGPGFAELALAGGAPVLPVYGRFDLDGRVRITFLPALDPPGPGTAHARRVEVLVDRYARFLEYAWRTAPESLPSNWIEHYLRRPPEVPEHSWKEAPP